jgi:diguanylate cyclase (GGDEF)-like protein
VIVKNKWKKGYILKKINILIVDDDIVDREQLIRTLKRSTIDCATTEVESVDQALEQLEDRFFDIILLDYNLPQRNGIELLLDLRRDPKQRDTAVIVVSTSQEDELALECLIAGAQDFLVKSDISVFRLQRAIVNAQARADLEHQLFLSYQHTKKLAERDSLTNLANRYFFDESFIKDIKSNQRDKSTLALLLLDLDHFKYVNDTYGHDVGDQLLIAVVDRINHSLRGNELFARLGGDEFAISLTHLSCASDAKVVAKRILDVFNEPFEIGDYSIKSGASIGISVSPDDSDEAKDLLKFADIAMYRAKAKGRNQSSFFEESMQTEFLAHFNIENQLRKALENNDFYLQYQPVINTADLTIAGIEALVRYRVEDRIVSPNEFIPIAEKTRLIIEIGKWVIQESVKQLSQWNQTRAVPLTMAVNLSSVQVSDDKLVDFIAQTLKQYDVDAQLIEFELTETALIIEPKPTAIILQAISDLGCKVSLDDFGTGFSSLSHLHSFPIDIVKIDKSLMPSASVNKGAKQLINGLTTLIKSLDLQVIAEGIETQLDLEVCSQLDISKMQGFYFDKPLTAADLAKKYL